MDRQDDGSQSQEFLERLARRFDDPIGVIDARYAQQKYARIADWLAERFGLVDQLRAKYGADEEIASDWQTMVMQQSAGEQINLFSTSTQSPFPGMAAQPFGNDRAFSSEAPSSVAEITTPHSTRPANDSLSAPEPKYRISRRRQPIASTFALTSPEHPSHPVARPASTTASGSEPQKAAESISQSDDVPRAIDLPFTTHTLPPFVFAKPLTEPEPQSLTDAPKRFESREASADQSPAFASPFASQSGNTGPEALTTPAAPSIAPLPLASARGEQSVPRDTSLPQAGPQGDASEHTRDTSLPLARPLAEPQRADGSQKTSTRSSSESAPSPQDTSKIEVASEVHDGALTRALPDIVWRNSPEPQGMTYSGSFERGPRITDSALQVDNSAGSPIAQQTNQRDGPGNQQPRDESRKDEIRIEQLSPQVIRTISERVTRAISLDLKIERERRGISKWR